MIYDHFTMTEHDYDKMLLAIAENEGMLGSSFRNEPVQNLPTNEQGYMATESMFDTGYDETDHMALERAAGEGMFQREQILNLNVPATITPLKK